jgi:hypothetical protein
VPARLCELIRAAKSLGLGIAKPNSGSHWKFERAGYRPYPVAAHNGERTEIPDKYIRGMCRAMGVEEAELRALL